MMNTDWIVQYWEFLQPRLGRPMQRGYMGYPGETFRFGRANAVGDAGAAETMRGWGSAGMYFPRKGGSGDEGVGGAGSHSASVAAERDFMALNRAAVSAGLISAPENYQFRATHDIRKKIVDEEEKKKTMTRRLPPTMVFGIATRPSTPIHDLLEHKYQDRWLTDRRSADIAQEQEHTRQRLTPGKVYETRASLLRVHQVPVEQAPLWQLPKFSKHAKPHLDTFRSKNARLASFKHHQSDCISRKGVFGHGVYEHAKN